MTEEKQSDDPVSAKLRELLKRSERGLQRSNDAMSVSTDTPDGEDVPLWRQKIRKKIAAQRAVAPVHGDDEDGNYCRFDPDGTKTILKTAAEQAEYDRKLWGNGGR